MAQAHVRTALTEEFDLTGRTIKQAGACTHRLVVRSGLISCVVKPEQLHWFFSSS
jgi:hypothetical protein